MKLRLFVYVGGRTREESEGGRERSRIDQAVLLLLKRTASPTSEEEKEKEKATDDYARRLSTCCSRVGIDGDGQEHSLWSRLWIHYSKMGVYTQRPLCHTFIPSVPSLQSSPLLPAPPFPDPLPSYLIPPVMTYGCFGSQLHCYSQRSIPGHKHAGVDQRGPDVDRMRPGEVCPPVPACRKVLKIRDIYNVHYTIQSTYNTPTLSSFKGFIYNLTHSSICHSTPLHKCLDARDRSPKDQTCDMSARNSPSSLPPVMPSCYSL